MFSAIYIYIVTPLSCGKCLTWPFVSRATSLDYEDEDEINSPA